VNEIREQGRTILFVSHSMSAVTRLCERVILLDKGRVVKDGAASEVVSDYMGESLNVTAAVREWPDPQSAPGNEVVRIRRVRVRTGEGDTAPQVDIRNSVGIEMTYEVLQPDQILTPSFDLFNEQGVHVFAVHDVGPEWRREPRPVGRYVSTMWIPGNTLSEGRLLVQASVLSYHPGLRLHMREPNVVTFRVVESEGGDSARGDYVGAVPGVVRPLLPWQTDFYQTTDIAPNRSKGLSGV
jgi:lipopolysaccharide transport system ATP-binding protein